LNGHLKIIFLKEIIVKVIFKECLKNKTSHKQGSILMIE